MKVIYDHQIFCQQGHGGISRYFYEIFRQQIGDSRASSSVFIGTNRNEYLRKADHGARVFGPNVYVRNQFKGARHVNNLLWNVSAPFLTADIYHSTYYTRLIAPRKARRILSVYDFIPERFNDGSIAARDFLISRRKIFAACDFAICISEATRLDLIRYTNIKPENTAVVYLGCNPVFGASFKRREDFILYVGARGGYKNYKLLKEAYERDAELWGRYKLICFGGGPLASHEVPINGEVIQLSGEDEVLADYYARAAVFVYPSLYEGFGLPILEAMASRCPIVTTEGGSLREIGGPYANYISGKDMVELADSIKRILAGGTTFLNSDVDAYLSRYTWANCWEETLRVYQKALGI
jgi:glycosyltransferase involved in cell wall biosynthesis